MMTEPEKERIYLEYRGRVAAYIGGRIRDKHTAEDLVSSVFLKVYSKLDSFDPERASLSTWIFTITRNTVISHYRLTRPAQELDEAMEDDGPGVEEQLVETESLERLAKALEGLKQKERDLVILHYYERLSLGDIAERMGISYSGAKLIHRRALEQLRLVMEG